MRRSLALTLFVVVALASNAFAIGQARITGKVTDAVTKAAIPTPRSPSLRRKPRRTRPRTK
jgi:hypothetical protein